MDEGECNALRLFAAQALIVERQPVAHTIAAMARAFPEASGLALCYVITELSVEIARGWSARDAQETALLEKAQEAVALLACDLFALQQIGTEPATGADLLAYWGAGDGMFVPIKAGNEAL